MHTITNESMIDVEFFIIDGKDFLGYSSQEVVEFELKSVLTYGRIDTDPIIDYIKNCEKKIADSIEENYDSMIKTHFEQDLVNKIECTLKK